MEAMILNHEIGKQEQIQTLSLQHSIHNSKKKMIALVK